MSKIHKSLFINHNSKKLLRTIVFGAIITTSLIGLLSWLSSPRHVLADSYFKLDEGYGTTSAVKDSNSAVSAGSITGAVWKTDDLCFDGKCLYFDGDGDLVSFGDDADLDFAETDSFTISLWFRHAPISSGTQVLIAKLLSSDNDGGYSIQMESDGDITCELEDNDANTDIDDTITSSAATYDDNRWHHVSCVKSTTASLTLYIDAIRVNIDTSLDSTATLANDDSFYIGIDGDGASNDYQGFIDEVKVYRSAKTAAEIKSDFIKGSTLGGTSASIGINDQSVYSDGLVGYWKMDESSGNPVDSSGNNNTLTNNNSTTYSTGKFGKGSEHVPASSQHFSLSSDTQSTYWIDGSDAACTGTFWLNTSNASDKNITTNSNTSSSTATLKCEGTDAPTVGSSITSVAASSYLCAVDSEGNSLMATLKTNGGGESLGTTAATSQGECTVAEEKNFTPSTPSGGWTWQKINDLEITYQTSYITGAFEAQAYDTKIVVTYPGGSGTISGVKTVSFWVNPDATTNYYLSLTSGAYITSSSGTISATGFTDPQIYVNGNPSTSIAQDSWQLVTVTSNTAIDANQFYIGRQGSNYFDGTMDDVRIYNRTLSPSEIEKLFTWASGPVAWWKMDENTGTTSTFDSSGNGFTGTLGGGTAAYKPKWDTGKFGSGLKFDGTDDRVDMGNPDTLKITSNVTMSMWVKFNSLTNSQYIFSKGYNYYSLGKANDGRWRVGYRYQDDTEVYIYDSVNYPAAGTWYHLTASIESGGQVKLYLNGVQTVSTGFTGTSIHVGNSWDNATLGAQVDGSFFNGVVDDVKIYNYIRTPSQIIQDMNAGHPAPGSPIGSALALWHFDDSFSTTAQDSSPNNKDLTLAAADWTLNGKSGFAWSNDGNSGAVPRINDDASFDFAAADSFSISFWYKTATTDNPTSVTNYVIAKGPGYSTAEAGYGVYFTSTGYLGFGIDDDTSWKTTTTPEDTALDSRDTYDTTWHHAVAVKNAGTDIKLYIDGILVGTDGSLSSTGSLANTYALCVGSYAPTASTCDGNPSFNGMLDEVAFYASAITADQVKVLYNMGQSMALGALSTTSTGASDNTVTQSFCPPGQATACVAPINQWSFDENTGITSTYDHIGGTTATLTGPTSTMTPRSWVQGKFGSALELDDIDDRIDTNIDDPLDITGDLTISLWVNRQTNSAVDHIISKNSGSGAAPFQLAALTTNALRFYHNNGTNFDQKDSTDTFSLNAWHHLAVTRSGSTLTFYIDGVPDSAGPQTLTYSGAASAVTAKIGSRGDGGFNHFDGLIDQLRIYNYARTPAQIAWDFSQGAPIVYYKFDECSGDTLNNSAYSATGADPSNDATIYPVSVGNTSVGTCGGSTNQMWYHGATGKYSSSLDFDGSDDYASAADAANLRISKDLTLSAWIYPDVVNSYHYIIEKGLNDDDNYSFFIHAGVLGFEFQRSPASYTFFGEDTASISTGVWTHVAVIYDDSNNLISFYVNGKPTAVKSTTYSLKGDQTDAVYIGKQNSASPNYFNGRIDELKIFNYALTPQQIKIDYNQSSAVKF